MLRHCIGNVLEVILLLLQSLSTLALSFRAAKQSTSLQSKRSALLMTKAMER
jgi:hypothetical protein